MTENKVFILGLDGLTLDNIRPWVERGELKNFRYIMENGCYGVLNSSIPSITPVAWSSFATGKNPGKHGIFDFFYREKGSYKVKPVHAKRRRALEFWNIIGQSGKKVGVVNVPLTYPPNEVNGYMLSGWLTPSSAEDYFYPADLSEKYTALTGGGNVYPKNVYAKDKISALIGELIGLLKKEIKISLELWKDKNPDFGSTVVFGTSIINHQMWHVIDETHPFHSKKEIEKNELLPLHYYQELDRQIGNILETIDDKTNFFIVSDHGFGASVYAVNLNTLLLKEGFLKFKSAPKAKFKRILFRLGFTPVNILRILSKSGLLSILEKGKYDKSRKTDSLIRKIFLSFNDVDWDNTTAYSCGRTHGYIYINSKDKEGGGCVEPQDYEQVLEGISNKLKEYKNPYTGKPLVGKIFRKEELYSGPCLDTAPDLIIEPYSKDCVFFGLTDFNSNRVVERNYRGASRGSGCHRREGVIFAAGPHIKKGKAEIRADIYDIAPTVLYFMDAKIPKDMDGKVVQEIINDDYLKTNEILYTGETRCETHDEINKFESEESKKEIEKQLENLGYLG